MPRQPTITKEEVFAACEALLANGQNPSVTRLRHFVGRGSYSTFARLRQEWEEERAKAQPAPESPAPPPTLLQAAERIATEAWLQARAEAEERLAEDRRRLEADREKWFGELESTLLLVDSLEEQCRQATSRSEQLQAELDTTRFNRNRARNDIERLQKINEDLLIDKERQASRIEKLEKLAIDRKEVLVNLRVQLVRLNEEYKEVRNKFEERDHAYEALRSSHQDLREHAARLGQAEEILREQLRENKEQLAAELEKARTIENKNNSLTIEVKALNEVVAECRKETGDFQGLADKLKNENIQLISKLEEAKKKIEANARKRQQSQRTQNKPDS